MLGDVEMHQPAPGVAQHHEHEEDPKGRRGHREEVPCDRILSVILQKRALRLRRRLPLPEHGLRNRRLRHRQASFQQLTVDPRRAPERIGTAHPPHQVSELHLDSGPSAPASTLPRPVTPQPLPVPPHHGLTPHHLQGTPPALPEPGQHDPEDPVHYCQSWPRPAHLPPGELLAKREVLQRQVALCRWCHDQTDAPYERGRLVVTALGADQFTFEVVTRVGPGTPPARVPAFALSTITKARGGQ